MASTVTAPAGPTTARTRASARTLGIGLAIGTGLAVVANLAVFVVGNLGAPLQVAGGGDPKVVDLDLASVVIASVAWLVIGAAGLWVCQRLLRQGFTVWLIGAGVIAAASLIPVYAMDVDAGSKVTLTVMHVVVAIAAVAGQVVAGRRAA